MRISVIGVGYLGAVHAAAMADLGHTVVRLDTNETLVNAIAMYDRSGYVRIDRYNDNPYATHFFEKRL